MLSDANLRIEALLKTTEEGFKDNQSAINDIEKISIKNARVISTEDEKRLIEKLSVGKGSKIEFGTVNSSSEAILFSGQLKGIFKQAGWEITNDERWLAADSKYVGLFLFVSQDNRHQYADLVNHTLNSLNFKFQGIPDTKFEHGRMKIVIGFRE